MGGYDLYIIFTKYSVPPSERGDAGPKGRSSRVKIKNSTFCDNCRPLKTLFSVNEAFKNTEGNIGQKFVFVLGNLANVGLAM